MNTETQEMETKWHLPTTEMNENDMHVCDKTRLSVLSFSENSTEEYP